MFLTGHTGFKGAWLTLWLRHLGARVTGYALAPDTTPNLCDLAGIETDPSGERGDIRDGAALASAMARAAPDIVLHLAAQPLVRRSYTDPALTFETNVLGTVHLLQAIRQTQSVACAVIVTSDKCYENREQHEPYREADRLGGHDPYSASKACAELAVAAWRHSFFAAPPIGRDVAIASARAGNVIGGGDWAQDRLIPDCIRAFAAGHPAPIRNPHAIRPWQHVLDPLCGYLLLAERLWQDGPALCRALEFRPRHGGHPDRGAGRRSPRRELGRSSRLGGGQQPRIRPRRGYWRSMPRRHEAALAGAPGCACTTRSTGRRAGINASFAVPRPLP